MSWGLLVKRREPRPINPYVDQRTTKPAVNTSSEDRRRVIVVGGGITGLAAAHRVVELQPSIEVLLLEAEDRLGGVLRTERVDGFHIEASADNFITEPNWGLELCRRIGIEDEIVSTDASSRGASVVCHGRLEPVPEGFLLMSPTRVWPVLSTRILSPRGKLRLMLEPFIPRRKSADDESFASFARRRLGREAYERLAQPLISGIYTADPEKLSMQAALPRFAEMEQNAGSLWRAARRQARRRASRRKSSGARYELFVAPRSGMSRLATALKERLPAGAVRLDSPVSELKATGDRRWSVSVDSGDSDESVLSADAVIVALPAPRAARLLRDVDDELGRLMRQIKYAGCVIVVTAFRRDQIGRHLDGFGLVVPEVEGRRILACSYSSVKFPDRAPKEHVLMRVFLGGACHEEMQSLDDATLQAITQQELRELLHTTGKAVLEKVYRWNQRMPQYQVGHTERVARIEQRAAALVGLELAGNAYHGVGVPSCIHSGESAAERVVALLNNVPLVANRRRLSDTGEG